MLLWSISYRAPITDINGVPECASSNKFEAEKNMWKSKSQKVCLML